MSFIVNLEARTIRGFESQGMIMAASDNDEFCCCIPHAEIKAGATQINEMKNSLFAKFNQNIEAMTKKAWVD